MQKFLISSDIGGASLTKGALEYILDHNGEAGTDNKYSESNGCVYREYTLGYTGARETWPSPLYTEWYQLYKEQTPTESVRPFNEIPLDASVQLPTSNCLRNLLPQGMTQSVYDAYVPSEYFSELDRLNGGCRLRIVTVPEGADVYIVSDDDMGCERVEEFHRSWSVQPDDEIAFVETVKRLSSVFEHDPIKPNQVVDTDEIQFVHRGCKGDGVLFVHNGREGIAVSKKTGKVALLVLAEYFCETDIHPKSWFEIVGAEKDHITSQYGMLFKMKEMKSYMDLWTLLQQRLNK